MRKRSSWCGLLTLLLLLGCASQEGSAQEGEKPGKEQPAPTQDREGQTSRPTQGKAPARTKSKKAKMDPRVYLATVWDRFLKEGEKPFQATEIRLFEPEVSLFGGSAGKESKVLQLRRGAATIEVPFERLVSLEVGEVDEDRLAVKVEIRAEENKTQKLEGSVKASLELRGRFAKEFKTTIKLREVKRLNLELDAKHPTNKKLAAEKGE